MKKIIFLDIDGVLNSEVDFMLNGNKEERVDIAPRPMKLLNELIEDTGAEVVVSSVWRFGHTVESMQKLLESKGFKGNVVGLTPSYGNGVVRGNEILKWIKDNDEYLGIPYYNYESYVIFDDDSDMLLWQQFNFIKVDGYIGLTPTNTYKARWILNKKHE